MRRAFCWSIAAVLIFAFVAAAQARAVQR